MAWLALFNGKTLSRKFNCCLRDDTAMSSVCDGQGDEYKRLRELGAPFQPETVMGQFEVITR